MNMTSKTSLIATLAIAGAFTAGFASGPAYAQTLPEPFKFDFRYDATELGSRESAEQLISRLHTAVSAYCGEKETMSLDERWSAKKCVKRTMSKTIDKFGNSTVAQAFQSRADG